MRLQLLPEDVVLVEEEDDARLREPLGVADLFGGKGQRRRVSYENKSSTFAAKGRGRDEPNRRA